MEIVKATGNVGAFIHGCSLDALTDEMFQNIQKALFTHGVVFFRDQKISEDGHVALAERFGEIDVNRFFTPVTSHPMIAEVRTRPEQAKVIGGTWHTDHSYDQRPAMASILVARELPPYGGDTLFAGQVAAAENLSAGLRKTLEGLRAIHSDGSFSTSTILDTESSAFQGEVSHPVIIRHPQTGQKALYVNGDFTVRFDGWTVEESQPLLDYLYRYCTQPAFSCRFSWQPGSVAIWDNRLVQHFATADYHGHGRVMHRITVKGQRLDG